MIPNLALADVERLCPKGQPKWQLGLVANWPDIVKVGDLTTPGRCRDFLAQTAEESGGFRTFEENLRYSAQRMTEVWPSRFRSLAAASPYANNPEKLANLVYAGRMGNTQPGDGWRYRGRGPIQITGKSLYAQLGRDLMADLIGTPDLLLDPAMGWKATAAYWKDSGANGFSDRNDFEGQTRRINGGLTNLAERQRYQAAAAKISFLPVSDTHPVAIVPPKPVPAVPVKPPAIVTPPQPILGFWTRIGQLFKGA